MNIPIEKKKEEAIKRMKALGIYSETIRQFKNEDIVSYSEPPLGANYWLDEEQKKIAKEFEEEYNTLIYFAVRNHTEFGMLDAFLYIDDYKEDWEVDNLALEDGYVRAYVYNYDMPDFSESGDIIVENRFGGLIRIG